MQHAPGPGREPWGQKSPAQGHRVPFWVLEMIKVGKLCPVAHLMSLQQLCLPRDWGRVTSCCR